MSRLLRILFAAAVALGVSMSGASAQDPAVDQSEYIEGEDGVLYKKKTEYDFEDDVVEGSFVRPEGEYLDARRAARHRSLIKIRENFIPEMLKSAEDI